MLAPSTTDASLMNLDVETTAALVRRLELHPTLIKRQEEEAITALVPLSEVWIAEKIQELLSDQTQEQFLASRDWSLDDLRLHVCRPEALRRFAEQRFGPGLEEQFLASRGARDTVIYSLLRSRDPALVRELWIRIEEGETSFSEAAQSFGEGPEAARKGLIGPMPIGQLAPPQFADLLRSLQPGSLTSPRQMGKWHVLLRLEQLTPARFDGQMRKTMLNSSLNAFLDERVQKRLRGEALESLTYHADS